MVAGTAVVALVCSAGGLAAMAEVISGLPADFEAAVIALQHAQPGRLSHLRELLARDSRLPVAAAEDGLMLRPGMVVVAPSGWHTLVVAGPRVVLIQSGAIPPSRPSADLLLTSLAVSVGSAATAVVLSGAGHDGAIGASAVKRLGGRVLACDAATSTIFGMPAAVIDRHVVDMVLPLADIAKVLSRP